MSSENELRLPRNQVDVLISKDEVARWIEAALQMPARTSRVQHLIGNVLSRLPANEHTHGQVNAR